jgi:hypothetical protein
MEPSLLHNRYLALEGNNEQVLSLLQDEVNVNMQTAIGETPLHYVCDGSRCTLDIIRLLISNGANVNMQTHIGESPLHYVCRGNECSPAIIRLLIDNGANVNCVSSVECGCCTALNYACRWYGGMESVRVLLLAGANPDKHVGFGSNILYVVRRRECGLLLLLIQAGASLEQGLDFSRLGLPLDDACYNANLDCVRVLIGAGMVVDRFDRGDRRPLEDVIFSTRFSTGKSDRAAQAEICSLLVLAGAPVTEHHVETLTDLAKRSLEPQGFQKILRYLRDGRCQPLSLRDQCRNTIRSCLFPLRSPTNPISAISQLRLPRILQEYILFNYQKMLVEYDV